MHEQTLHVYSLCLVLNEQFTSKPVLLAVEQARLAKIVYVTEHNIPVHSPKNLNNKTPSVENW